MNDALGIRTVSGPLEKDDIKGICTVDECHVLDYFPVAAFAKLMTVDI